MNEPELKNFNFEKQNQLNFEKKEYYLKESLWQRLLGSLGFDVHGNKNADIKRQNYSGDLNLLNNVSTDSASISDINSSKPILATGGIGPCVSLCGYDPRLKIGFLLHVSSSSNFDRIISRINEYLKERYVETTFNFQFYLIGGIKSWTEQNVNYIKNYVHYHYPNSAIVHEDVLGSSSRFYLGKSFLLDIRNGNVYSYSGGGLSNSKSEPEIK